MQSQPHTSPVLPAPPTEEPPPRRALRDRTGAQAVADLWGLDGDAHDEAYYYGAPGAFVDAAAAAAAAAPPVSYAKAAAMARTAADDAAALAAAVAAAPAPAAAPPAAAAACPFFLRGNCRFGDRCRNPHVLPDVQRVVSDEDGRTDEERRAVEAEEVAATSAAECGICYEPVKGRFGLLPGCAHAFCLACIREWRQKGLEQVARETARVCPLCRVESYFVVPSHRLVTDPFRKQRAVDAYVESLARIPCRNFVFGDAESCPHGSSCFYAHLRPDGTPADERPRILVNADGEARAVGGAAATSLGEHFGALSLDGGLGRG